MTIFSRNIELILLPIRLLYQNMLQFYFSKTMRT